jgi:hypothetical protein
MGSGGSVSGDGGMLWWSPVERKGPQPLEDIEGGEMQLQHRWEDRVGGAHHEGLVGGCSSWNQVCPAVGNGE